MKNRILVLLIVFTSASSVFGQRVTEFSHGNSFIDEFKDFMTASKSSSMEDLYKSFDKIYKSGYFSQEQKDTIISTANLMLGQRMTANPYFSSYVKALMQVKNTEEGDVRFAEWHKVLKGLLASIENRRVKPYKNFLDFSLGYFEKKALRSSKIGVNWLVNAEKNTIGIEGNSAVIRFEKTDLMAVRKGDTIVIKGTSGYYSPEKQVWTGHGGRVTWERLGLDSDVFVELNDYQIEVKKSLYEAKNVKMHYPLYFGNKMVEGDFSDKLVTQNRATEGSYPRFQSKESVLEIKNIGEGILYKGGFKLQGTTVYGFGTPEEKAEIKLFNKNKELVYDGLSELFTIRREERIVGERVQSTLYFGQDSIFHPSVNLKYDIPKSALILSRGQRGSDRNPFFNSMHRVNIDSDQLEYFVNADSIYVGKKNVGFAKSVTPSTFESFKYFEQSDYNRLQNIASTNPIALMKVAYLEVGDRVLEAEYLAKKLNPRFSVENIKSLLYDLVAKGFINYDSEKQLVELKDKVFHYADASQKKVDYDILRVTSETRETNAVLNLKDNSLAVNGVKNIEFSAAQKVGIKPQGNIVTIKEDLDMDFDGKLFTGFTTAKGKGFHFSYDNYSIGLDSVKYFDLFIPTGKVDKKGQMEAYSIGSRIEDLSGVVLIDAPSNKSGIDDIAMFPSMESKTNSYVYYDRKGTLGGVYKRDSFYFKLKPFSFQSLDKFGPQDVHFKGRMYSADIFPQYDETLVIKEDSSLGFYTKTPPEGYPTYSGKGEYLGAIDLSNKGYMGQGTLNYLGASLDSDDLIFRPKQLTGSAERFDLEEVRPPDVEVPQVRGYEITMDWRPYKDSMYIRSKEAPFELYKDGRHRLTGTLILSPGGLNGRGLFDWDKASMTSNLFRFGAHSATSDTTDLKIKAFDADAIALSTSNLNGTVDFDKQIGSFKANAEFLTTTLPYNQYETSFNEFDWDMKEETVKFKVLEGKVGSFLSIHPDQDSLRFDGTSALYDLKTNVLKIGGVPYIVASDAFIYPETGDIEILPGAVMTELKNAKIIADTLSKYHVINKASVKILGKKEYRASGFYEYNIGDKKQEIEFAEIIGTRIGKGKRDKKKTVTRATGEIDIRDKFYIDHKTLFQGTITLNAEKPNLGFDGFAKIEADKLPANHWFSIQCEGDKNDLAIAYKTPLNPEGESLHVGLFLSKETASTYPRILMPKFFRKDRPIMPINGYMQYDEKTDQYIFGDSLRIFDPVSSRGNKLVFDNRSGEVIMEGKLNLGSGLKHVSISAAGKVETEFGELVVDTLLGTSAMSSKTALQAMFGTKLIIPDKLLSIMANDFKASSFDAAPIVYAQDAAYYKLAVSNLFPENDAINKAIDGIALGTFAIPKKQNDFTFLFSKVPMVWDRDYQSFVSTQEKLGLISIKGEMLNTTVTAYIEAKMPTNDDDRLYIYIKSPSQLYYFFGYKQGILNVVSNNTRFMDELNGLKDKERIFKMGDDDQYEIQVVEPSTANAFVNRAKAAGK
ncbi:MAG TPA: hypothetical protein ENJ95_10220 [Bacteroidetes bacterium]|nr:hypothetical protein [Bacteroidota bacterium]